MEVLEADLNSTRLKDRVLWYDGDSTVNACDLLHIIQSSQPYTNIFVDDITDEVAQYNRAVEQPFKIKTRLKEFDRQWNIDHVYKDIDIPFHVFHLLERERINNQWGILDKEYVKRQERVEVELVLYRNRDLFGVLRALIYIINTLEHNNIVWGVGRGSSVSSYILYLLKVHDVDSVLYELDISDFLRG